MTHKCWFSECLAVLEDRILGFLTSREVLLAGSRPDLGGDDALLAV